MKKVFIRFPTTGKIYSYPSKVDKINLNLKPNQQVLAENEGVIEMAIIVNSDPRAVTEEGIGQILRILTENDRKHLTDLKIIARQFIEETRKKSKRHGLDLKILDADLSFDEKKLTFYFSADSRVDFRSLVTDLVKSFNKLIRLQQVGTRDEAKYFESIGKCGRELCCAKFLNNLESITLEMAQIQELATAGSSKLSGCCGKLMCCLAFEAENYEKLKKQLPKIGSDFRSSEGRGKVIGHNILEGKVLLEKEDGKKIEVLI